MVSGAWFCVFLRADPAVDGELSTVAADHRRGALCVSPQHFLTKNVLLSHSHMN